MKRVKKKQNDTKNNLQIGYVGNVTVKVVRNNEVVKIVNGHNSGNPRLFEYIAKCLSSNYESVYAPKYIQIFHVLSDESVDLSLQESLAGIVPLSSATYKTDESSSTAQLTFVIPGATFTEEVNPNYFALYSYKEYEHVNNPMAVYYLEEGLSGSIDRTSNIIVVWELKIGNATFEE